MTSDVVVIGIGNSFRRDDGLGVAVADEVVRRQVPNVRVVTGAGDPLTVLDAWSGARLAVIVDAAGGDDALPGRIRRCGIDEVVGGGGLSSHAMTLRQTYDLGRAMRRVPERIVVFTVDAADTGQGVGLTPAVCAAVSAVVDDVIAEAIRAGSMPEYRV